VKNVADMHARLMKSIAEIEAELMKRTFLK